MVQKAPREKTESDHLVASAFELARSIGLDTLIVQADELRGIRSVELHRRAERIVWLIGRDAEFPTPKGKKDRVVTVPDAKITRMSRLKLGLLLGVLNQDLAIDESVLCLTGLAGSRRLDTLLVTNPLRDFPWFKKNDAGMHVATREFARLVDIGLRLASEGREGRPIGTIFVLGEMEQLSPYLSQLILNPCEGHPKKHRNIHDDEFLETLREFAALDGAFVVNTRGVVESAGTYLDASLGKTKVRRGLGARHTAAAAITATTPAVAVVVSESSGTVTVFHKGKPIFELENPHPRPFGGPFPRPGAE